MTPAARVAAAIEILDRALAGAPAERELTTWARRSRFAGAKDRAAIRDHVYDALRRRRSLGHLGGADTGRGLMIGAWRAGGRDPAEIFTGTGYAPAPLSAVEARRAPAPPPRAVALDVPDWLLPRLETALGADTEAVLAALQARAPLFLRVNSRAAGPATAAARLAEAGIVTRPGPLSPTALEVVANPRGVARSEAFRAGLVEIQDAASQAVADAVPIPAGGAVLDLCAGGGGKTLAMAARVAARYTAFDADPRRMQDLPDRARRAGIEVACVRDPGPGPYDVVLADAPCSGSGSWRRMPQGKWTLTEAELTARTAEQSAILARAARLLRPEGTLAYATCSMLREENEDRIAAFLDAAPQWRRARVLRLTPLDGGDGFFLCLLRRRQ